MAEADRGRHPGFPRFNVVAGGPGSLADRSAKEWSERYSRRVASMLTAPEIRVRAWIITLGIWLATALLLPQASGQEPKNAKWQYCDFTREVKQTGTSEKVRFALTKGKVRIEAASLKELGEKLKMKDTPAFTVTVLDHLGEDGWELVSFAVVQNAPQTFTEVYMLKRER
jgi:hypothetical protein